MFDKFTPRARQVIILARKEADRFNHSYIGTEHLLLGIIKLGDGVAFNVLRRMGIDFETVRLEIEKSVGAGPETKVAGDVPLTSRAKKVIELAVEESNKLNHTYVGTEHILLGLIKEGEGIAAGILIKLGLDLHKVKEEILQELMEMDYTQESENAPGPLHENKPFAPKKSAKTPALDAFGRDLTEMARNDKLDPVIGRKSEIERVIQVLCRRTKNNPVLIGEAGVGKTAIVEGLAHSIVKSEVPEILLDKKLVTLDLALMIAGTKYRGQFEERIKAVMEEIKTSKDVILFIDELHTIVGAGAAEGAIDASNILKPALARGDVQCIGATTMNEYRKFIEKDAALERRFQIIKVEEPSVDETVQILEGLKEKYEKHHNAVISDEALVLAAKLSDRYIADRFLPDKAIDLIDEASAKARISAMTTPPEFKDMQESLNGIVKKKETAINRQAFEDAASLRDKERTLREEITRKRRKWNDENREKVVYIGGEEVAQMVSRWTGIPVFKLEEAETEKLLRMEQELHKRIIGQEEPVSAVSKALRRSRADLKDPRRPIGSFIFLGPTGVGKTLLAKALAEFLFDDEDALIQIDMSEYMEKFNVSRLTGSPPGYVGYEEGGQLTEKVRRRPYSVVLFDEIEKAHPDVMHILLQILEEGKLTDSYGRKVDFRNTVVIMTSNVGAAYIEKATTVGFHTRDESFSYEKMKEKILSEVKSTFKPEFLNRIDEIIVFQPLTKGDLFNIIDLEIRRLKENLGRKDLEIKVDDSAKKYLLKVGYNPSLGARPLKRAIQKHIEDAIAEEILRKKPKGGAVLHVFAKNTKINISIENKSKKKKRK
ncbi:MAG: ATP-dependent Clp protease ATP-binding subunit [Candidatus Aureabacteria bacterium]|nr:ATP-dependent Clp protease ATP-binding subunit [Candidatus Auribacterota bacterium]